MKYKKYKTYNHAKTKLLYHLIFSTKYRKAFLEPLRNDLFNILKNIEKLYNTFCIEIMEINKDHIHFLLKIHPKESISNVVRYLKQHSTYWMWKMHYDYLRQFYRKEHKFWTRGYFVSTIGDYSEETLKQYIKNQS